MKESLSKEGVISTLAEAVIWLDEEVEKIKAEIKEKATDLLKLADELAENLSEESEAELRSLIKDLSERLKEIEKSLEEEHKEELMRSLKEVEELSKENFEKAVNEVEKTIIKLLGGA